VLASCLWSVDELGLTGSKLFKGFLLLLKFSTLVAAIGRGLKALPCLSGWILTAGTKTAPGFNLVRLGSTTGHELEALSIFHCRTIFDRFNVLFIVKRDLSWVQAEEVANLVAHIVSQLLASTVLKPDLQKTLLGAQTQTCSNNHGLLKLLT